jgi:AcrR family transcriptional regulator
MAKSTPAKPAVRARARPRRNASRQAAAQPYHHGDLRRVLIHAAMELVGEGGPDAVRVREVARRAGVSPGAPFRHFASRDALIAAVAEEAQRRFRTEIDATLAKVPVDDPLARFRALGLAYMRWAIKNPAHFEIISTGRYHAHDKSAFVARDNAEVIVLTERLLAKAHANGQLGSSDLKDVLIGGRSLVYGFARMSIDGHFPRWGVAEIDIDRTAGAILDLFLDGIARRSRHR